MGDSPGRRTTLHSASLSRANVVCLQGARKGEERTDSSPLEIYSAPGGLRQAPRRAAKSSALAGIYGRESRETRAVLTTYGSRGDVEPVMGLVVRLRALGRQVRVCAPSDCAAAEGCDALVATGVVPEGVGP
jgi:hypothetical protein